MKSKEFDVLRFVEHNGNCYVSSEHIEGVTLAEFLSEDGGLGREKVYAMIQSMLRQLDQYHRSRGNPSFTYVNPYSMILSDKHELFLLDVNAQSSSALLRLMRRRNVRECFLPREVPYYQESSVALDIYGLGKSIQFLLSKAKVYPELTPKEEKKFQILISKCIKQKSKHPIEDIQEIQRFIPIYEKEKREPIWLGKLLLLCFGLLLLLFLLTGVLRAKQLSKSQKPKPRQSSRESVIEKQSEEEAEQQEALWDEQEPKLQLALLYFLELEDYEKSRSYFQELSDSDLKTGFLMMMDCLQNKELPEESLRTALNMIQAYCETSFAGKEQRELSILCQRCNLKTYARLDEKADAGEILRIGERLLKEDTEHVKEICESMGRAYELLSENEQAIAMYQKCQKEEAVSLEEADSYTMKIAELYQKEGDGERAKSFLREQLKERKDSRELRIYFLRLLLKEKKADRQAALEQAEDFLEELPELESEEAFIKLLEEEGWELKGGKICQKK